MQQAPPATPTPEAAGEARPLLVYDGDCGLCQELVGRYEARAQGRVDVLPGSALGPEHPHLAPELLARSVAYVDARGEVHEGADAVVCLLHLSGLRWPRWLYRSVPGFAPIAEWAYRLVAANRHRLGSRSCKLPTTPTQTPPRDPS